MSKGRNLFQLVLVVLVLGVGVGALAFMRSTKPQAEREEKVSEGLLVEVQSVRAARHEVSVRAHGTVIPKAKVVVQPQLSGRVIAQSPHLAPGGRLKQGEVMVRIDPRDYQLALEARKADVSRAKLELSIERGQQQVAAREWKMFGEFSERAAADADAEETLALRGPQVRTAKVAVEAAESALARAQLDLSRSVLRAPFNALVLDEQVDVGQLVSPQTQLATLVGIDAYWVQVSIPVENLAHITVPGAQAQREGSLARVIQRTGSLRSERIGRVVRLLPDLDAGGAMARVLIEVDHPLGDEQAGALPLLLNAYVDVEIEASAIDSAIEIPRAALRDGNRVFVVDRQNRLRIQPVEIAWRRPDSVLISAGLTDGAEVVVSPVAAPVDGMSVRKENTGKPSIGGGPATAPAERDRDTKHVAAGQAAP